MIKKNEKFFSDQTACDAWLYYPDTQQQKFPVVVMGHGFGGTKALLLENFARAFVQLGFAAFVFDYRHWGDSDGEPRNKTDYHLQKEDWHYALKYVRSVPDIDQHTIILWGTSFSGGLVLSVAAEDHQIKAVISQCPMLDGRATSKEHLKRSGLARFLQSGWDALLDETKNAIANKPHYIDVIGPPGSHAAMTSEDAWAFRLLIEKELPYLMEKPFYNKITARSLLNLAAYRPIKQADQIQCPVLLVICKYDTFTPIRVAENTAKRIQQANLVILPLNHFDIYYGDGFKENIALQVDFLTQYVKGHIST